MTTDPQPHACDAVRYEASFPQALVDDAGRRFTAYVYRRLFGRTLALAMAVNVIGCVACVALAGWTPATAGFCALIGLAALYFAGNYALRPGITARRLQRAFGNGATITLRPDGFDLETPAGKMSRPWGRQRALLEFDDYFLLVILPTIGLVLPRQGMPAQGVAWVRAAMQGPMTKPPFPGL